MTAKHRKILTRIIISALVTVVLLLVPAESFSALDGILFPSAGRLTRLVLYIADYLIIGFDIVYKALRGIFNRRVFDENFLMCVATFGAMALAAAENGDYTEAVAVMLFYQTGELLQSCAVGRSRRSISALMDIRPDYANVEKDGAVEKADPESVPVGGIIVVRPGEKIPSDGVIIEGSSSLNVSALTGESLPLQVGAGDTVMSGCINLSGRITVKTTKAFGESTASKILELVENAASRKSRCENFISKFARVYTPLVCCAALVLALVPPMFGYVIPGAAPDWGAWIYRALTFLIISCPCALVISVPLTFFAGIGGAGKEGILIKGSNFVEVLSKARCAVLDKTGTLTRGSFEVTEISARGTDRDVLLDYAAAAESSSSHPIGKSILRAYGRPIDLSRISDVEETGGSGILARVDGKKVAVGNSRLMADNDIACEEPDVGGTVVHVAVDDRYLGYIVISDSLKPQSKDAVAALRKAGVSRTVMLTGDRRQAALRIADELGIDEVFYELLPSDKVDKVELLLEKMPSGSSLVFAGDGINDAPVLSRADAGIAMGALGSDAAIEAADVVIMDDDPLKIAKAVRISRKCMGIVRQNIFFALSIKLLFLVLGAAGLLGMWAAVFADVGVTVIAVLNAIRALNVHRL